MRYLSSRSFLVGLLLVVVSFAVTPLFVTALAEETCTTASPENPSWGCSQPYSYDFRIPAAIAVSGIALMLGTVARMRRRVATNWPRISALVVKITPTYGEW